MLQVPLTDAQGTCIRDNVHIRDFTAAHLLAIEAANDGTAEDYNIGTGRGHSVLEIFEACEGRVTDSKRCRCPVDGRLSAQL